MRICTLQGVLKIHYCKNLTETARKVFQSIWMRQPRIKETAWYVECHVSVRQTDPFYCIQIHYIFISQQPTSRIALYNAKKFLIYTNRICFSFYKKYVSLISIYFSIINLLFNWFFQKNSNTWNTWNYGFRIVQMLWGWRTWGRERDWGPLESTYLARQNKCSHLVSKFDVTWNELLPF